MSLWDRRTYTHVAQRVIWRGHYSCSLSWSFETKPAALQGSLTYPQAQHCEHIWLKAHDIHSSRSNTGKNSTALSSSTAPSCLVKRHLTPPISASFCFTIAVVLSVLVLLVLSLGSTIMCSHWHEMLMSKKIKWKHSFIGQSLLVETQILNSRLDKSKGDGLLLWQSEVCFCSGDASVMN